MMLSIFQKQLGWQFTDYIGNGVYSLYSTLTAIKDRYNTYSKTNQSDINISFTILHKNDINNVIEQEYSNTVNDLSSDNLSITFANLLDQSTANEEILLQNNNNSYNIKTRQHDNSNIILHDEEISYEMAYSLLLNLVNNNIQLLEEALLIAKTLVSEGVLVAPESRIKKNIAQIVLHNIRKQTVQSSGYSR
ncbi:MULTISPECIES: hypothetical protein [Ehrlichia]|uniref:Uncharacterized protein n=1 Tax=Ehrlichia cf. muris str. EmCRT TaxID=1359167 RepID=A0A0F3NDY4_9RICK|nr:MULTISPECIES: hypothetical protein [Ehrlichia]KJV65927.1 hypothetical protein EMUCRT_0109 [Ehrlichia cf. muris str. EmCRT]OUC04834.1 hypothetical protein DB91_01455 [Ehrlichia sp. Wisconsin_h]